MKQLTTESQIILSGYWLIAIILITTKAIGLSTLSWFWSTLMISWPFVISFGIFAISIVMCGIALVIAALFCIFIETLEWMDRQKIKKQCKDKNNE